VKSPKKKGRPRAPRQHHLDRRAAEIKAASPGADDELLNTVETAAWLGCSTQWLTIGRHRGYGPPFEKLAPKMVRYRRSVVRAWLDSRTRTSTVKGGGR
jgi:predicted DNA-binding transcriptional regulator AlpA